MNERNAEAQELHDKLIHMAVCGTPERGRAVTALIGAAASMLSHDFGPEAAAGLIVQCITDSLEVWRKQNGICTMQTH